MSELPPESRPRGERWLGPALLGALLVYTAALHHGIGPVKPGYADRWYTPTGFLLERDFTYALLDPPGLAFLCLGLPALLLLVGVLVTWRSALAAAVGVSCVIACLLFTFYGLVAPFAWQFFGACASLVLVLG